MAKWMLRTRKADFDSLALKYHTDPLLIRVLVNRGIIQDNDFDNYLNCPDSLFHDPCSLKDMDKAVDIISDKLTHGSHIRIVGDYDVDGVCAAAVLTKCFKFIDETGRYGCTIDTIIPHRVRDGYGLNPAIITAAADAGVDTLVTCDNGISARNEIQMAVDNNMTVVVTDHHEVPFEEDGGNKKYILPNADAIVDPKRSDCEYPFKNICGAMVAYKLVIALLSENNISAFSFAGREDVIKRSKELTEELFELASLATVADIMELKDENRSAVRKALKMMTASKNKGIAALIGINGLKGTELNIFHLGFVLGPCINASGRIDSADRALSLLLTEDETEAVNLAADLKAMNDSRKKLTQTATEEAVNIIESGQLKEDRVLVVYIPDCHESVAGIVAGRLREKYMRPVMVITQSSDSAKGSGRSIEAYNMYEEMTKVADIFTKYGGHSQAAGFSLNEDRIDELRERLNKNCTLTQEDLDGVLYIDAAAPFSYCTERLVEELDKMEPVGNGNEACVFARKDIKLIGARFFGEDNKVGKYRVKDTDGFTTELTMFQRNNDMKKYLTEKYGPEQVEAAYSGRGELTFSAAYTPSFNVYQGRRRVQYVMVDYC